MGKYVCDLCGWEYDPEAGYPEAGIAPGTAWEDVPEDFVCPLCGAGESEVHVEEFQVIINAGLGNEACNF